MPKRAELVLSDDEREVLERWGRRPKRAPDYLTDLAIGTTRPRMGQRHESDPVNLRPVPSDRAGGQRRATHPRSHRGELLGALGFGNAQDPRTQAFPWVEDQRRGFMTRAHSELPEGGGQVALHGALGEVKLDRDLLVLEAQHYHAEDLFLPE